MDESVSLIEHRTSRARFFHYSLLILITAVGAALRFSFLDRPAIWGDEAVTFARVCGSFDDLLHRLSTAGFAPLHYELLWLIGQRFKLTPTVLRMGPAIAGTLLAPVMYWLTRELLGPPHWGRDRRHRSVALLAALLTACSAYLLDFSRDAKMYSIFWLLMSVNIAALLCWLRTRRGPAYFAWVASGAAMLGFDTLGCITLIIELLIVLTARRPHWGSIPKFLTALIAGIFLWALSIGPLVAMVLLREGAASSYRRWAILILCLGVANWIRLLAGMMPRWRQVAIERILLRPGVGWLNKSFNYPPLLLFIIGLLLIAAGPVGYYIEFNKYIDNVENDWDKTGIQWVDAYNHGRTGASLIGYTASAYLVGWEWPRSVDQPLVSIRTFRLLAGSVIALSALLAMGLLPWPSRRRSITSPPMIARNQLPARIPPPAPGPFRASFWMTVWLVLPPYGFYLVSMRNYAGPSTWVSGCFELIREHWWTWPLLLLWVMGWVWMSAGLWKMRLLNMVRAIAIAFAVFALAQLLFRGYPRLDAVLSARSTGWAEHKSVWITRYIGVIVPPFLILVSVLLLRLPTRPLRFAAIALLVIVNLSQHAARLFAGTEPPTAFIAHDLVDSTTGHVTVHTPAGDRAVQTRSFFAPPVQNFFGGGGPGTASMNSMPFRYYLALLSNGLSGGQPPMYGRDPRYRPLPFPSFFPTFDFFVANNVRRSQPPLDRFVTWQRLSPGEVDLTDPVLDQLAPDWRLESQSDFVTRDHWRWVDLGVYRRRVYRRSISETVVEKPTSRPTTRSP